MSVPVHRIWYLYILIHTFQTFAPLQDESSRTSCFSGGITRLQDAVIRFLSGDDAYSPKTVILIKLISRPSMEVDASGWVAVKYLSWSPGPAVERNSFHLWEKSFDYSIQCGSFSKALNEPRFSVDVGTKKMSQVFLWTRCRMDKSLMRTLSYCKRL